MPEVPDLLPLMIQACRVNILSGPLSCLRQRFKDPNFMGAAQKWSWFGAASTWPCCKLSGWIKFCKNCHKFCPGSWLKYDPADHFLSKLVKFVKTSQDLDSIYKYAALPSILPFMMLYNHVSAWPFFSSIIVIKCMQAHVCNVYFSEDNYLEDLCNVYEDSFKRLSSFM